MPNRDGRCIWCGLEGAAHDGPTGRAMVECDTRINAAHAAGQHAVTIAEYRSPEGTTRSVLVAFGEHPATTIVRDSRVYTLIAPSDLKEATP